MRTCVRRMSVRGKKEFEVRKIDRNERISDTHAVSLHQRLDMPQFHFAAPLVALLKRGLQDKEQIKRLTLEAEFVARYTATIGGRNLELARVCLSKVCWLS